MSRARADASQLKFSTACRRNHPSTHLASSGILTLEGHNSGVVVEEFSRNPLKNRDGHIGYIHARTRKSSVELEGTEAVLRNGDMNERTGRYKSVCCSSEILVAAGLTFPDCPNHRNLPTIWKPVPDKRAGAQTVPKLADSVLEQHIENRRLFGMASGDIKFSEWEKQHLRECKVCKGVLYVFVNQPLNSSGGNRRKPGEAA